MESEHDCDIEEVASTLFREHLTMRCVHCSEITQVIWVHRIENHRQLATLCRKDFIDIHEHVSPLVHPLTLGPISVSTN